jgi:hypothetical protein
MENRRSELFDVKRFGAVGDGQTPATAAIQKALDACGAAGGGTVLVPAGRYLTGALFLRSHVHLQLAAGSALVASQRFEDFPLIDGRWEGIEQKTHSSLLTGIDLQHVNVTGQGVLDGQGMPWWTAADATRRLRIQRGLAREAPSPPEAPLRWPRPRVINLVRCQRTRLSGFTVRDSPAWNIHLLYCQDVAIDTVAITGLQAYDCCGIIIDSCRRVSVANCAIAAGADCIGIKSGYNEDGRRVAIAAEDVTIANCNLTFANGSGLAVGSETAGGIRNVTMDNCVIANCKSGITIRSTRGRGGVVERITAVNLVLDRLLHSALTLTTYFDSVRQGVQNPGEPPPAPNPETDRTLTMPVGLGTPTLRDIEISNLTMGDVPNVAIIEGLPERYIEGVRIQGVRARLVKSGISLSRVRDVSISGLAIEPSERPAVMSQHVKGLDLHRIRCSRPPPRVPMIQLERTEGVYVHACDVAPGGELVRLEGEDNHQITVSDNNVAEGRAGP